MMANRGHHDLGDGHSFDWQVVSPCEGHDPDDDDSCSIVSPHTHDWLILSGDDGEPGPGEQIVGVVVYHPAPPDSDCIPHPFGIDLSGEEARAVFDPDDPTQSGRAYITFGNIELLPEAAAGWGAHLDDRDTGFTIESFDPLSIGPIDGFHSLLCPACGDHGWVHGGRWLTADIAH